MGGSSSKFSSSTTDLQILDKRNLQNQHFLISGGSSGIGLRCATSLVKHGASVTIASRSLKNMQEAKSQIENEAKEHQIHSGGRVQIFEMDLANLDSIKSFVDQFEQNNAFGYINVLMLNAGLFVDKRKETEQGFEFQFGVNHLGHFALLQRILAKDLLDINARIVVTSSKMHSLGSLDWNDIFFEKKRKYSAWKSYGQSKLANILFVRELAKKLAQEDSKWKNVHVYAVHPGWIRTNFDRDISFSSLGGIMQVLGAPFQKSIDTGAATNVYCAVHQDAANETGLYYDNCHAATPSKSAQSDEDARKLWAFSVEKTGLDYFAGKTD
eukprot:CAMPEP_0117450010 /NCGR_PEP_ID=MMETSP0759-20121206/8244_1 /TAXON_ID=63605 /ORGANISM="Percolomonas cosmopolitus, Strain WS" /LENGTH=325 /DNA_ID=CAMNT_0005242511 /DNA_START=55 /DNA_END=1032 /DNA_ORIENTATION=-